MSASDMALAADPVAMRIARAQRFEDLLACHLFEDKEDMVALCWYASVLSSNAWFERIWTVQEGILGPTAYLCIGPVSLPLDTLFEAFSSRRAYMDKLCCHESNEAIFRQIHVLASRYYPQGHNRQDFQAGEKMDLIAIRFSHFGRSASLDIDHIYGLLGLANMTYDILPDYRRSAGDVFVEISQTLLSRRSKPLSFWMFIYAPIKDRHPELPSWAIDWTSFERTSRNVWVELYFRLGPFQEDVESNVIGRSSDPDDKSSRSQCGVRFEQNTMITNARFVATVNEISVHMDSRGENESWRSFCRLMESWRALVMSHHAPHEVYRPSLQCPEPTNVSAQQHDTWASAWLKLLCGGHIRTSQFQCCHFDEQSVNLIFSAATDLMPDSDSTYLNPPSKFEFPP
ncbi:hypothetical protein EK21DRAFT_108603 [Setomelanomma holmii]|uniref:Heterokaryon incompatibility domain-containing protein n=1 Tax=Setomelanomma holmii TaxID=210430 RepID=A0A9P4HGH3_9PLEO|nr:hypothetical protein EK21DRAFT_108603 [Setomelanomma holmii]